MVRIHDRPSRKRGRVNEAHAASGRVWRNREVSPARSRYRARPSPPLTPHQRPDVARLDGAGPSSGSVSGSLLPLAAHRLPTGRRLAASFRLVQNIHANGPNVYGHEIYHLSGAVPNTTYQVTLLLYPFDPTCSAAPAPVPTTQLRTNAAGNGNADFVFAPSDVPAEIRNATHGIRWSLTSANSSYETACSAATLD